MRPPSRRAAATPLFEDGQPSRALVEQTNFCSSLRDNLVAASLMAGALDAAGMLNEEEANITFNAGGQARIRGFKLMLPGQIEQADDATYLDWRRRGWIAAVYAHLHSSGRWSRLIELAAAAPAK